MKKKISNKTASILLFIAAILYFILFFKDKNYTMLVFGFTFTTLGCTYLARNKTSTK